MNESNQSGSEATQPVASQDAVSQPETSIIPLEELVSSLSRSRTFGRCAVRTTIDLKNLEESPGVDRLGSYRSLEVITGSIRPYTNFIDMPPLMQIALWLFALGASIVLIALVHNL